jgi:LPS export ABC transporter protein LptC
VVLQTKASVTALLLALACILLPSCNRRQQNVATIDVNTSPMMHGEDITSLISDSGVTRFRLETKVWDAYVNDTTSFWHFPQGIYIEQFDSLFQVSGHVEADTAYYFDQTGIWRLVQNVRIKNAEGTTCETSELYWNSKEPPSSLQSIYTERFATITTPNKFITTEGFKANQSLTKYILYDNVMETEIDETAPSSPADTLDKAAVNPVESGGDR